MGQLSRFRVDNPTALVAAWRCVLPPGVGALPSPVHPAPRPHVPCPLPQPAGSAVLWSASVCLQGHGPRGTGRTGLVLLRLARCSACDSPSALLHTAVCRPVLGRDICTSRGCTCVSPWCDSTVVSMHTLWKCMENALR